MLVLRANPVALLFCLQVALLLSASLSEGHPLHPGSAGGLRRIHHASSSSSSSSIGGGHLQPVILSPRQSGGRSGNSGGGQQSGGFPPSNTNPPSGSGSGSGPGNGIIGGHGKKRLRRRRRSFGNASALTITDSDSGAGAGAGTGAVGAVAERSNVFVKRENAAYSADLRMHDEYEDQQHALEAALDHYAKYGDVESLNTYLNGFQNINNKAWEKGPTQNQENKDQDSHSMPSNDNNDGHEQNHPASEQPKEDCEASEDTHPKKENHQHNSEDHHQHNQQLYQAPPAQSQSQPQPQSQSQPQPDPQPQSQPQPQPQSEHESKSSPSSTSSPGSGGSADGSGAGSGSGSGGGSSVGHSDGSSSGGGSTSYHPPAFSSLAGPSVSTLYSSTPFVGRATYYNVGLGACGATNVDSDPIVAVSSDVFQRFNPSDGNPNRNSLCGHPIEISWKGKKTKAYCMDECPSCPPNSLDLSPTLFEKLDKKDLGVLNGIQWNLVHQ